MSVDWEALAAAVVVMACTAVFAWGACRLLRARPELRPAVPVGLSAWWRARRVMRRSDVDTWAWELYVEDWYARHGEDEVR